MHWFSGGQRQRIAIARAGGAAQADRLRLAHVGPGRQRAGADPEPSRKPAARTGAVLLFITHNMGVVEYIADEVAVMQGGRVVE